MYKSSPVRPMLIESGAFAEIPSKISVSFVIVIVMSPPDTIDLKSADAPLTPCTTEIAEPRDSISIDPVAPVGPVGPKIDTEVSPVAGT